MQNHILQFNDKNELSDVVALLIQLKNIDN